MTLFVKIIAGDLRDITILLLFLVTFGLDDIGTTNGGGMTTFFSHLPCLLFVVSRSLLFLPGLLGDFWLIRWYWVSLGWWQSCDFWLLLVTKVYIHL